MSEKCRAAQNSISLQGDVFRLAERDHGLSLALLSAKTEISIHTLRSWRDGTVMPAWAFFKLGKIGGIPAYLLTFMSEPFGHAVIEIEAENDLDLIADDAAEFVHEYAKARSPHGPGGISIVPQEAVKLTEIAKRMAARARAA